MVLLIGALRIIVNKSLLESFDITFIENIKTVKKSKGKLQKK